MTLSAETLFSQILILRIGAFSTGGYPAAEVTGLIKGVLNAADVLPYERGRSLVNEAIRLNSPSLVTQCVKAYPWQESTSWFLGEWVGGTASALGQIQSYTKPTVIKALIQGGELNFLAPLTQERSTGKQPSEMDILLAGRAIAEIYDAAQSSRYLPLIMDALKKKLTQSSVEYSLDSWAEKGVFDSDKLAAYNYWKMYSKTTPTKHRLKGPL